ncbi:ATP-binding cassette domain-containing protein, partial [Komagataeibacter swingsii]|uniref:ATP-binding cassette domain-containing protein n=1 Tax=Komagataeibacter swingsii TaxID=215220 RepID=UPI00210A5F73
MDLTGEVTDVFTRTGRTDRSGGRMIAATYAAGTLALEVQGLCCAYGGPFTFSVLTGQCVAITGPSGSGKTVMLRMIADLDPHEGEVRINGQPCLDMPAERWRRLVQYVPAEPAWWSDIVL